MILVTGGTGLLGSHLLLELVRKGRQVRALKRPESDIGLVRKVFAYYDGNAGELFSKIIWTDADLLDFQAVENSLTDITEIYHCGAAVSFHPKDYSAMLKVNIESTANLVNLALDRNISRFLHVSSIATLGRADNKGLTDEETYWKPASRNSVYSVSKYGAEREVWRGIEEGLNAVIVNPSIILGPGFWNDASGLFPLAYKGFKFYPKGGNGFVNVNDVVKAMIFLMENNISRERFIINSENISYLNLFTWIAKYLGKPAPSVYINPFLTSIAWRADRVRVLFTGSKPMLTKDLAAITSQTFDYSNEKIQKLTRFKFEPVEESIRGICEIFMRERGI